MTLTRSIATALLLCILIGRAAGARDTSSAAESFQRGVRHIDAGAWTEALAEFGRSASLRPTPITIFNMGYCERALGHYTRAQVHFERALALNPGQRSNRLSERESRDAQIYLREAQRLLAHVNVVVNPADAQIAVDGRPLAVLPAHDSVTAVAGTLEPGPERRAPAGRFELILDPGPHVLTLSHQGYKDLFRNEVVVAAAHSELALHLSRPIYRKWWFWGGGVAVVGLAVGLSVGLSLSPPPLDGGSTGWVVRGQTTSVR